MSSERAAAPGPGLAVLFGDQLDRRYPEALGLDPGRDVILMMEVAEASTTPPSHVQRTVMFLAAMRHHAAWLRAEGWTVDYVALDDADNTGRFDGELARAVTRHRPARLTAIRPGDHAVLETLRAGALRADLSLELVEDPHFLTTPEAFARWASGRRALTMEHFYRAERRRLGVLMDGKDPVGGKWNLDHENRRALRRAPEAPAPPRFPADAVLRAVVASVEARLPELPGRLESGEDFAWPVTREQALVALDDFMERRLPRFGDHQDAMWLGERTLWHSLLSGPLNLKLLDPREVVARAVAAWEAGRAPLNAVEGFVRQIIGWREFIRGVYWLEGPEYARRNALEHHGRLPASYWTADTDLACLRDAVESVLQLGYGHHIARLMVMGNFALIAGIEPRAVSDWYLGMFVDGVDQLTAPNVIGMALHADGGVVGSKPYAASGRYIQRMSNACAGCRYDVEQRSGPDACPFNVFYWDFLIRHRARFERNPRMALILKHVEAMSTDEEARIGAEADALRLRLGVTPP